MIIAQFRQGHPVPIPPFPPPTEEAMRCRVTGESGKYFEALMYDVIGRNILMAYSVEPIGDPFDVQFFDATCYNTLLAAGEGVYLCVINIRTAAGGAILEQLTLQFVIAASANVKDVTCPDKTEVYITDKDAGLSCVYQTAATTARVPFGKFVTTLYKFNPEKKQAFIQIYYGTAPNITDLGWFTRAILTVDYRFEDDTRMFAYLVNAASKHTTIPDDVYDLISRTDVTVASKIDALMPYAQVGIQHDLQGRILGMRRTSSSPPILSVDVYYKAGWLNVDWRRLLGYMAIGAAMAGAVAITLATMGVGLPIGWMLVVGAIAGAAVFFVTPESPSQPPTTEEKGAVEGKAEAGKDEVDEQVTTAKGTVDTLVAEGKVTPEAGERIKADIDRIGVTAKTVIDELTDEAKRQIDAAYNRGFADGSRWAIVAGVGGFAGGLVLGTVVT